MFTKIHKPLKVVGGDNKSSSFNLMEYLSKEDKDLAPIDADYKGFFNQYKDGFSASKAMQIIDGNNQRLGDQDVKFYMLTANPSWEEQQHLIALSGNGCTQLKDLSAEQKLVYEAYLKSYTNDLMSVYANAFTRKDSEGNAINLTANDLNYVAKIEYIREYKIWDKPVKHNLKIKSRILKLEVKRDGSSNPVFKRNFSKKIEQLERQYLRDKEGVISNKEGDIIKTGHVKGGLNTHIHVVVSRQTKSKWYKGEKIIHENGQVLTQDKKRVPKARGMQLSPNAKGRGNSDNHKLNDKTVHVGFHQEKFKSDSATLFNEKFDYKSKDKEHYQGMTYRSTSEKSKTLITKLSKQPIVSLKNQTKGRIAREIRGSVGVIEEKIVKAAVNPKAAVIGELKNKVKQILTGRGLER